MNTVNEERMKHIRESSEKIDRARSEIRYASYGVISNSFDFVRDGFASFDESEKKECMKEIFDMVRMLYVIILYVMMAVYVAKVLKHWDMLYLNCRKKKMN